MLDIQTNHLNNMLYYTLVLSQINYSIALTSTLSVCVVVGFRSDIQIKEQ